MSMTHRYSVVLHPAPEVIEKVREMKARLAATIGWFNSKNSVAHITINEFEADDSVIARITKQLTSLCDALDPTEVCLNAFGSYPNNGAFFIAPDEASKKNLKVIMKHINDTLQVTTTFKSSDPHLSIARRLPPEKIGIANSLFTNVAMHFVCDSVVLRKFNTERKQFEVVGTFMLHGNPTIPIQGSLF